MNPNLAIALSFFIGLILGISTTYIYLSNRRQPTEDNSNIVDSLTQAISKIPIMSVKDKSIEERNTELFSPRREQKQEVIITADLKSDAESSISSEKSDVVGVDVDDEIEALRKASEETNG